MLPKLNRLSSSFEIRRVQTSGKRFESPLFTLIIFAAKIGNPSRFAFLVSKRLDKRATKRNRTKRLLREAVRLSLAKIEVGYDVIISAKEILAKENIETITIEVKQQLEKAGLVKN